MDMHQLTDIFCQIDDFCNRLDDYTEDYMLTGPMKGKRGPECGLAISEIMTILVMFQSSRVRDFKNFYTGLLCHYYREYFPRLPCYERFVSLMKRAIFPLIIFTQLKAGQQAGIYYIDSSCLPVCHIRRASRHKTFDEVADYGHTSVGWFFGSRYERQLLNQRGIIETVIGHLKHCYQVWHTRHRPIMNALTHLVAALAAYTIQLLQLGALKMLVNWSK
jgi:hypothetical protein